MSSPIKPPGKPPGAPPASEPAADTGKASFDAALDEAAKTEATKTDAVDAGDAPAMSEAISTLAKRVESGELDVAAAVDELVARALGGPTAAALPPARRAELEAHLRRVLADDPALTALTQDLERGG